MSEWFKDLVLKTSGAYASVGSNPTLSANIEKADHQVSLFAFRAFNKGIIGIRLGTAAVSTRGLQPADMDTIAQCIDLLVTKREAAVDEAKAMVKTITERYPLYK